MKKSVKPDPVAERPNLDFSKGERGKYSNLIREGSNVVILDPALVDAFHNSQSVNDALHAFLSLPVSQREAAIAKHRDHPGAFTISNVAFDPRKGTKASTSANR